MSRGRRFGCGATDILQGPRRSRRGHGRECLLPFVLPLGLLTACADTGPPSPAAGVRFEDVTLRSGIHFEHYNGFTGNYYYVETFGSGAAFLDYDGDGWLDLYLVNGTYIEGHAPEPLPVNRTFRNHGGSTFTDVTSQIGGDDPGYGFGVAAGDYDADGDADLFVANWGPNSLYRNDDGTFSSVGAQARVLDPRWASSAAFLDADLDGDLDLFVANYVRFSLLDNTVCKQGKVRSYCQPDAYEPMGDILYRNDGGTFTDVSLEVGIVREGRGLGVALSDYDLDGDTDVYVANDGTMNFLYDNRRGLFAEVGLTAGSRYDEHGHAEAGMGVDFGDYDNDLDADLFITNFARETNTLYANDGQGHFRVRSALSGLADPSYILLGFGTRFLDFDHDADLDLFVANGHVIDVIAEADSAQTYRQPNQMFRNDGGRFEEVSAALGDGFSEHNVGRAAAVADFDNDGDIDLLVTTVSGRPRLLRNEGRKGHWLMLELTGGCHPDALGARVYVTTTAGTQVRERQSGGSYLSSHDPRLHFGLGDATHADVEVHWPDGEISHHGDVAADQILRLEHPGL